MEIFWIVIGILVFLTLGGFAFMLAYTWPISKKVYHLPRALGACLLCTGQ